jgi:hypothetical protein
MAGVICGFLAIVQSAGFGLLLLSGGSQTLVPEAVGMALFSTAVMAAVAAATGSTPGVVAIAQGAALAGPVAAIIAEMGMTPPVKEPLQPSSPRLHSPS